jgi:hypothetical protein
VDGAQKTETCSSSPQFELSYPGTLELLGDNQEDVQQILNLIIILLKQVPRNN